MGARTCGAPVGVVWTPPLWLSFSGESAKRFAQRPGSTRR